MDWIVSMFGKNSHFANEPADDFWVSVTASRPNSPQLVKIVEPVDLCVFEASDLEDECPADTKADMVVFAGISPPVPFASLPPLADIFAAGHVLDSRMEAKQLRIARKREKAALDCKETSKNRWKEPYYSRQPLDAHYSTKT